MAARAQTQNTAYLTPESPNMKNLRLVPDDTKIDFLGKRFLCFGLSTILMIGSLALVATRGLNFGIDFTGGTLIEVAVPQDPDLPALRSALNTLDLGTVSLQEFGDRRNLMIRLGQQPGGPETQKAAIGKVQAKLAEVFPTAPVDYRRTEYVGPQVGKELKLTGLYAMLFSVAGILAYIWMRFEWQFGVGAVLSVVHDAIATLGLFSITHMEFDLSTLAAVLLVAGYSINDTVVVFDRIRENMRKYKKTPLSDLLNLSVNQTLSRSIMTSLTTLLALTALLIFGGDVIRSFTYALVFGILVGTYSSVYVAAPLLLYLNLRRDRPEPQKTDAPTLAS